MPAEYLLAVEARRISRAKARSLWGDTRNVNVHAVALKIDGLQINALQVVADEQGSEIVLGRQVLNRLKMTLDGPATTTELIIE